MEKNSVVTSNPENQQKEIKKIKMTDYFVVGTYIDAKSNKKNWQVARIIKVD